MHKSNLMFFFQKEENSLHGNVDNVNNFVNNPLNGVFQGRTIVDKFLPGR